MPNITVEFPGLSEIKEMFDHKVFLKDIREGVSRAAFGLNRLLEFEISNTYNAKPLDSVRVGKSISTQTTGKNIISAGLTYRYKAVDLSKLQFEREATPGPSGQKFFKSPYNPEIQSISILRNSRKVLKGKYGKGGFIPKAKGGDTWRSPSGRGAQMFERIGKARSELKLLFGPSLTDMVETMVTYNPTVMAYLENLDDIILEHITMLK